MTKLFLHIGHSKTGSTAIQVSCARSSARLAELGIIYPEHRSTKLALSGNFTAGNVVPANIVENYASTRNTLKQNQSILYSCEGLFDDLATANSQVEKLRKSGVDISVLLFLRNPVEYALSFYQQKVKGAGHTGSLHNFMYNFDQIKQTETVINRLNNLKIPVTMHKFDASRKSIIELTEDWLNLPADTLKKIKNQTYNRSATRAEQFFLRELSSHLGPSGSDHIDRALVNDLPAIAHELPELTKSTYDQFINTLSPDVERLNGLLDPGLHYEFTPYENLYPNGSPTEKDLTFSREQLQIIAKSIASRAPNEALATEFIRWVKQAQTGDVLTKEDIYRLNRLGQAFRPGNFPEERLRRLEPVIHTD